MNLRVKFDDDDGGFTVLAGELKGIPEGWKEVTPGRFEPQWPGCRLRGLSKRVVDGVPVIIVHCNHVYHDVDVSACKDCKDAEPKAQLSMPQEILEEQMVALEGQALDQEEYKYFIKGQEKFVNDPEGLLKDQQTKLANLLKWPACVYRKQSDQGGCCPKLICTSPDHVNQDKVLKRKDCTQCGEPRAN